MLIDAIDHVQLAMPPGNEDTAAAFYEGVLGVPRVPKPSHLSGRGGCWFERGSLRIHLGVQADFVAATKAHPAFTVADLAQLEDRLRAAGHPTRRGADEGVPQVYVDDPFGNRLEFVPQRPTGARSAVADEVVAAASATAGLRVASQFDFVHELDRLKTVERQSMILDALRRENTAEHSWHVAMLALVFADLAGDDVDIDRVVRMLLVHDIVEIDAGDTGVYDPELASSKQAREREAADRLFGMLPDDVGIPMRQLWDDYEEGSSPDAHFARVFDRISPFLLNLGSRGLAWTRWGVTESQVRGVMANAIAGAPTLGPFIDEMIDRAVADGLLVAGRPPDGAP